MLKIDEFLHQLGCLPRTKKAYVETLCLFERHLDGREPTEEGVRSFLRSLEVKGKKASTRARHLATLRKYFEWEGIPLRIKIPRIPQTLPAWLTLDQMHALLSVARTPLEKAIVTVLYDGALRVSELLGLMKRDIDWDGGYIRITGKGGDERRVPVGPASLDALKEYISWRRPGEKIFPYDYGEIYRIFRSLGKRAGLKVTPHMLRHSRATRLRAEGIALEDIKDFLGHKKYDTTLVYAHILPVELRKRIPAAFGAEE